MSRCEIPLTEQTETSDSNLFSIFALLLIPLVAATIGSLTVTVVVVEVVLIAVIVNTWPAFAAPAFWTSNTLKSFARPLKYILNRIFPFLFDVLAVTEPIGTLDLY